MLIVQLVRFPEKLWPVEEASFLSAVLVFGAGEYSSLMGGSVTCAGFSPTKNTFVGSAITSLSALSVSGLVRS